LEDVFEPVYSPRKVEFWLDHWEELDTLVESPKSAAHIAEHLNREWVMLQVRMKTCLCKELHASDAAAVDPGCRHEPTGGGFRTGTTTALCIVADLRHAADKLPPNWHATHKIWQSQMLPRTMIDQRSRVAEGREREPVFARYIAVKRMAGWLGWRVDSVIAA
jgi:hypothetical protein